MFLVTRFRDFHKYVSSKTKVKVNYSAVHCYWRDQWRAVAINVVFLLKIYSLHIYRKNLIFSTLSAPIPFMHYALGLLTYYCYPFHNVSYYIKWVTTSWTCCMRMKYCMNKSIKQINIFHWFLCKQLPLSYQIPSFINHVLEAKIH